MSREAVRANEGSMTSDVKALAFDVFGTVVDWRGSIIEMGPAFGAEHDFSLDWAAFADAWRAEYQPAMERVRSGKIGFVKLDVLHRMNLEKVLRDFGVGGLSDAVLSDFNRMWHRLSPWPDAVAGLHRLKTRYILATLSNGNVSLIVNMAKRAGLPWDMVLGAEIAGNYKPAPEVYRSAAEMLDLAPPEVMMVAAHNGDLVAARGVGFRTAFVARPREYGPHQATDLSPEHDYDIVATDFVDLAHALGA